MYTGILEQSLTDEDLGQFYNGQLRFDLKVNQYLVLKDKNGKILDKYKNENGKIIKVKYKVFESKLFEKIKPRNCNQELLMDLLDSSVPCVFIHGTAGTGKSYISTSYAVKEMELGHYEKIVIIRPNVTARDIPELGATPGDVTEKMRIHCAYIADIVSDFYLDSLLSQNKIELAYIGTLRSRSFNDCVVLVNECENLTPNLTKLILSRVGENSKIIWDGDIEQSDKNIYAKDNGMVALVNALTGHPLFGMVELVDVERSELAKMAALI